MPLKMKDKLLHLPHWTWRGKHRVGLVGFFKTTCISLGHTISWYLPSISKSCNFLVGPEKALYEVEAVPYLGPCDWADLIVLEVSEVDKDAGWNLWQVFPSEPYHGASTILEKSFASLQENILLLKSNFWLLLSKPWVIESLTTGH